MEGEQTTYLLMVRPEPGVDVFGLCGHGSRRG